MRKVALLGTILCLAVAWPLQATSATPVGDADNPLGTPRWLPANANEKPSQGRSRLVVVYDFSRDPATGQATELLAKGPFGAKFYSPSPDIRMVGHSPSVGSLQDASGQSQASAADEVFMGVEGDIRDGACTKVGADFSAAYTATRSFLHSGTSPYEPISAPGTCEVVDSSTEVRDASGALIGYDTVVTNHVPGFWVDVTWAPRTVPVVGTGHLMAEVWYGGVYDTAGEDGAFYEVADANGDSTSTGNPGDYDQLFSFTANPGSFGDAACPAFPEAPQLATTNHQDVKVQVPEGSTKATFRLFPKGDWDLRVIAPDGTVTDSGLFGGFNEQVVIAGPAAGEYTVRACNYSGEPTTFGGAIIE